MNKPIKMAGNPKYFFNEETRRYCKVGSPTYKRLMKKLHQVDPENPLEFEESESEEETNTENTDLKNELLNQGSDMIMQNQDQFKDIEKMTQKELDKMLKKLLMKKLQLNKKKKPKPKKKPKLKTKKKKKKKKITPPPSSSESESESASGSESSD